MTLDLSFLEVPLAVTAPAVRPVNVYDILRDAWRETRVDMTLQFFLDPNERHGLGSIVMDALLRTLDGATLIRPEGGNTPLPAEDFTGSTAWEIGTQVEFIDVYAVNREHRLAVVLENKIGHELNNPLAKYATTALMDSDIDAVLVVVLAPEKRAAPLGLEAWLSRSITYAELADEIKRSPGFLEHVLNPGGRDERRSIDLLQQFIEARIGGPHMSDLKAEEDRIEEWRGLLNEHAAAIEAFEATKKALARLMRDRSKRLESIVAAKLEDLGLTTTWEAHGGTGADFWNAYCFSPQNWSIELKMSTLPQFPSAIYVQHYAGRTYKPLQIETLDVEWSASDEEVADAFIARVQQILEERTTVLGHVDS